MTRKVGKKGKGNKLNKVGAGNKSKLNKVETTGKAETPVEEKKVVVPAKTETTITTEKKVEENKELVGTQAEMRALSFEAEYELPKTKAVLKPLINAGEEVAKALMNNNIDFGEWAKIIFAGIPLATALKDLQHFVAETKIINKEPKAKADLLAWFKNELDLPQENVEWIVENTVELALHIWGYIVGMQDNFVVPQKALKEAKKGK